RRAGPPGPRGSAWPLRKTGSREERVDEFRGGEWPQVLGLLADADETDRDRGFARDRRQRAALRGAVELGDDEPGEPKRFVERLHLAHGVLPGIGIEHQPAL